MNNSIDIETLYSKEYSQSNSRVFIKQKLQASIEKREINSLSMNSIRNKRKVFISDCAKIFTYDSSGPIINTPMQKKLFLFKKKSLSYKMWNKAIPSAIRLQKQDNEQSLVASMISNTNQKRIKSLMKYKENSNLNNSLKRNSSYANIRYEPKPYKNKMILLQSKIDEQFENKTKIDEKRMLKNNTTSALINSEKLDMDNNNSRSNKCILLPNIKGNMSYHAPFENKSSKFKLKLKSTVNHPLTMGLLHFV